MSLFAEGATRDDRVAYTMKHIGGSVLNGAFSTFLAVLLLGFSQSFVFRSMFFLFFYSIVLGVYHGVVLLPVMLGLFGPQAHITTPVKAPP